MSQDRREALVRHYLDEVFNRHDLSRLDKYLDADLASHWLGDRTLHGLPAWKEAMAAFFVAFPDVAVPCEWWLTPKNFALISLRSRKVT